MNKFNCIIVIEVSHPATITCMCMFTMSIIISYNLDNIVHVGENV